MSTLAMPETLEFPYAAPPKTGEVVEVRPGVFWARLALPFRLDHVNIYLVEDGAGLALIDTGIDNAASRAAWDALLAGPLAGRRLTRIIATHFHPDHIGLAGWLCERFDLELAMSQTEYLMALNIRLDPSALKSEPYRSFYRSHGLGEEETEILLGNGLGYLRMVSPPPTNLPAPDGGRPGDDRRPHVRGHDRRGAFARTGHAPFGGRQHDPLRRSGPGQDLPQCQRRSDGPRRRPARPLSALARQAQADAARGRSGPAGAQSSVRGLACPRRRAGRASRGALHGDRRGLPRPGRRRWPSSFRSSSGAGSTTRTSSCSPSAKRWRM